MELNITEPKEEYVILVDEYNNIIGTTPKSSVHQKITPLHRAFSIFIFNEKKELLLQQRAKIKKTWPLVWSNSCCGHPKLNESNIDAAIRRCYDELGIKVKNIKEISPYRYCFSRDGVQENEICPILIGEIDSEININLDEVEEIKWISWKDWLKEIKTNINNKYSEWCIEETIILNNNENFNNFLNNNNLSNNNKIISNTNENYR